MNPVTIVVTTHNNFVLTRACIESITWSLPPDRYELIIVDDRSTDATADLARDYRFISNEQGSLYRSWNLGIDAATHDHVVVANNDVLFCSIDWWRWLDRALEVADWVFPECLESQAPFPGMYAILRAAERLQDLVFEPRRGYIEASSFAINRSLLDRVGRFDPQFDIWYGEKDFEIRLLQARCVYGRVRNAITRHYKSSTLTLDLGERRPYEALYSRDPGMDARGRRDHEAFLRKWSPADLERVGLCMPPYGRRDLAAGDDV
jgi:GT2 family glycosyltransferase